MDQPSSAFGLYFRLVERATASVWSQHKTLYRHQHNDRMQTHLCSDHTLLSNPRPTSCQYRLQIRDELQSYLPGHCSKEQRTLLYRLKAQSLLCVLHQHHSSAKMIFSLWSLPETRLYPANQLYRSRPSKTPLLHRCFLRASVRFASAALAHSPCFDTKNVFYPVRSLLASRTYFGLRLIQHLLASPVEAGSEHQCVSKIYLWTSRHSRASWSVENRHSLLYFTWR